MNLFPPAAARSSDIGVMTVAAVRLYSIGAARFTSCAGAARWNIWGRGALRACILDPFYDIVHGVRIGCTCNVYPRDLEIQNF